MKLKINKITCKELIKVEIWGENDPFVIIDYLGKKIQTDMIKDAGSECEWNNLDSNFEFELKESQYLECIKISVQEGDNMFSGNKDIGQGTISIRDAIDKLGQTTALKTDIYLKSKRSGLVTLYVTITDDTKEMNHKKDSSVNKSIPQEETKVTSDESNNLVGSNSEESIDLNDPEFLHFLLVRELELFEKNLKIRSEKLKNVKLKDKKDESTINSFKKSSKFTNKLKKYIKPSIVSVKKSHPYLTQQIKRKKLILNSKGYSNRSQVSMNRLRSNKISLVKASSILKVPTENSIENSNINRSITKMKENHSKNQNQDDNKKECLPHINISKSILEGGNRSDQEKSNLKSNVEFHNKLSNKLNTNKFSSISKSSGNSSKSNNFLLAEPKNYDKYQRLNKPALNENKNLEKENNMSVNNLKPVPPSVKKEMTNKSSLNFKRSMNFKIFYYNKSNDANSDEKKSDLKKNMKYVSIINIKTSRINVLKKYIDRMQNQFNHPYKSLDLKPALNSINFSWRVILDQISLNPNLIVQILPTYFYNKNKGNYSCYRTVQGSILCEDNISRANIDNYLNNSSTLNRDNLTTSIISVKNNISKFKKLSLEKTKEYFQCSMKDVETSDEIFLQTNDSFSLKLIYVKFEYRKREESLIEINEINFSNEIFDSFSEISKDLVPIVSNYCLNLLYHLDKFFKRKLKKLDIFLNYNPNYISEFTHDFSLHHITNICLELEQ